VKRHPTYYLVELQAHIQTTFPLLQNVSTSTICRALNFDLNLSRKVLTKAARECVQIIHADRHALLHPYIAPLLLQECSIFVEFSFACHCGEFQAQKVRESLCLAKPRMLGQPRIFVLLVVAGGLLLLGGGALYVKGASGSTSTSPATL
ncbi:TPA: hypothetical protein N0F65_006490, partial [Lagenidium giganteum]